MRSRSQDTRLALVGVTRKERGEMNGLRGMPGRVEIGMLRGEEEVLTVWRDVIVFGAAERADGRLLCDNQEGERSSAAGEAHQLRHRAHRR